ncbi:MAG: PAS domain S-box protein, partial [Candidatus Hodarchaeales archaeon]
TEKYLKVIGGEEFKVHPISEPLRVFEVLKEKSFDIIVTDYQMPRMNGLELLSKLKDENYDIPVIIFTGRGREEVAISALNLGASYYIEKGGDLKAQFSELRHVMRQVAEHKRIEKALSESEERYRIIFNESPISLWEEDFSAVNQHFDQLRSKKIKDIRKYFDDNPDEIKKLAQMVKIADVNNTTLKIYNAKNKNEFFEGLTTFFNEEATILFKEELIALFSGRTVYQSEFPGYKLTGEKIDVIVRLSVIPGYEQTLEKIIVSVIDITQQKKVEKTLRNSERRFRELSDLLPQTVFEVDLEGNLMFTNRFGLEFSGYSQEELNEGLNIFQMISSEDKNRIKQDFKRTIKGEDLRGHEYNAITKNGNINPVLIYSSPITIEDNLVGLRGIIIDISHLRLAQDELRKSEERYRRLIELSPDAIILSDLESKLIMVNRQAVKLYGATYEDELIGKNAFDFIVPEDHNRAILNLQKILESGSVRNIEYSMIRKGGTIFSADLSAAVIFNEKGKPTALIGVIRDISERKKIEETLRSQKEELSEFAHFIAHDINNCLTAIEGYTSLLDSEYDETHIISRQIEYMKKLLTRSLALADAGLTVEKKDLANLNNLVKRVALVTIPKNIVFSHDILPEVHCDEEKLFQVFKNIFENAVIHGKPQKIEVKLILEVDHLKLLIINDGITIPPEIQDKLFNYGFTTLKDSMGLGLSIIKKIIEAHGWNITVQSNTDKTTFQISIPLKE